MNQQISHKDVARFFLAFANEAGEPITNLKLQKLVYYAQAWYLANYNKPLFEADFEAWVHGPVIPKLYQDYKKFGFSPITSNVEKKESNKNIDEETLTFLNEVAKIYMPYGAYQLELMTHNEEPWVSARKNCEPDENCNNIISKESMKKYYGQKIKNKTN